MPKHILYIFRIALSFAFLYPAIAGLINPSNWIGFLPTFAINLAPFSAETLLIIFGISEIIIGIWLLLGKNVFIPSAIASVMLFAIIVFNFRQMDVIFRDVALFLVAVGLSFYYYQETDSNLELKN